MREDLRRSFSEFIIKTRYKDLPEEIVHQAKRCILDFIGVALAGSRVGIAPIIKEIVCAMGGKEEATIIGDGRKVPAGHAALINAAAAHTLDMDDCQRYASAHPGIVTIPAAFAIGEREDVDGKKLIEAVVVGYEMLLRIASAINPSHLGRGFHTTGTVGPFAAAAACSKLMGLSKKQVENALSIAGLQGAGLLEVTNSGQMMKPLQPARAVQAGVLASLLAKEGAQGPDLIFEGEKGFLKAFSDVGEIDDATIRGLEGNFKIMSTAFKFYAVCRVIHPSVDAALEICNREGLDDKDVETIEIETFPYALRLCGTIVHPDTPLAAKFSIPFSVAMAVHFGDLFVDKFTDENVHNKSMRRVASRVKLSVGEEWARSYPEKKGASVTIRTHSGKVYSSSISLPKGEPENPASLEDLMQKFLKNASRVLSNEQSQRLGANVMQLENLFPRDITQLLCGEKVGE